MKKIILSINVPEHLQNKNNEDFINKFKEVSNMFNKNILNIDIIKYITDEEIEKQTDNSDVRIGMKAIRDIIFN
jgi:hypothetical protein